MGNVPWYPEIMSFFQYSFLSANIDFKLSMDDIARLFIWMGMLRHRSSSFHFYLKHLYLFPGGKKLPNGSLNDLLTWPVFFMTQIHILPLLFKMFFNELRLGRC